MSQQNKPTGFTILMDDRKYTGFKALIGMTLEMLKKHTEEIKGKITHSEFEMGIELIDEMSDKGHETFGCNDIDCSWKPKNKPVSQGEI